MRAGRIWILVLGNVLLTPFLAGEFRRPRLSMLRLKRIYEAPEPQDGERFLVERLWPRGVSKESARLAGWLKDLAPSPALRQWFHHEPSLWTEFRKRYEAELRAPDKQDQLRELADKASRGVVTLVYAARDPGRNSALVLAETVARLAGRKSGR